MDVSIEESWKQLLTDEFHQPYFEELSDFVRKEYATYEVFPNANQIFRAFDECPFDQVKVVILGQDPYHTKGMAHGLCFSVDEEVIRLPPSLKNIYKELENDLGIPQRSSGDLGHWARQGVLLLNTVLTVRTGEADSHSGKGWEKLTDAVINILNERKKNLVYMLWGGKAEKKAISVDTENNLLLKAPHPSPLSAHRGFLGCGHFSKTNEYLQSKGLTPIKW